jgi:signal transduction histidine kinase
VGKRLRALLVEDSTEDAALLRRELVRAGFDLETEQVATAAEFSAALDARTWDVVLSDFAMPGFGGKAALEILQSRVLDVPFIIVSGTLGEEVAVEVIKAGAQDYFSKGNTIRLGSAIEREMREAEARRQRAADQQRAEAERERLMADLKSAVQARDDFLAIASHELKTPLTGLQLQVQGLARMCLRDPGASIPTAAFESRIHTMARQVRRLTKLIQSLLDVTRITTGDLALAREELALDELVVGAVDACKELVEPSKPQVTVDAERIVGEWDPLRMETIVTNIVSNAIKFGTGRPVSVTVRRVGDLARLSVVDRGIGIPLKEQQRIFEKFECAVPRQHYGGFGFGLWIVRQLVAAHGGTIQVESAEGQGSTFTVDLPLRGPGPS